METKLADEAPVHFTQRWARIPRMILQWALLWPVTAWFFHPFVVRREKLPRGPIVFVANHSSHADTAALLRSLPVGVRVRTHPAAAQDHFWRRSSVGAFVSLLTGAFPFPRSGCVGIDRAQRLLDRGCNVLLYPEGTRSTDGRVAGFHKGVGILAERGATIVPVGIAGTGEVLPKGATRPRSGAVSVVFGDAIREQGDACRIAERLRDDVTDLVADAEIQRARGRDSTWDRVRSFAGSRAALVAMFVWAFAEALIWPVIPDFLLLPLAMAVPSRLLLFAFAALMGSLGGGLVAWMVGPTPAGHALLLHAPLVSDRMAASARFALRSRAGEGLLGQPLSGIPYKAFALQSAEAGLGVTGHVFFSAIARGSRFIAIAGGGAAVGTLLQPVWRRFFGAFLVIYAVGFAVGLARVVESWS